MRGKHIKIILSESMRKELEKFTKRGEHSVRLVNRAKIILELDEAEGRKPMTQEWIAGKVGVSRQTVNDAKKAFLGTESVSAFLKRKKRGTPPVAPKVTGELEARIVAIACGKAPQGRARWTLQLLADKCVELHYVDALSPMTVHRVLKKRTSGLT